MPRVSRRAGAKVEPTRAAALHAAALPVSVINPARVRQFARASGQLVKTDPLAAAVLAAIGQALTPPPTPPRTATELKLAALSASRSNHLLKPFYDRLIQAGKPAKVALTAVMRKLIVLMNHLLKIPTSPLHAKHRCCGSRFAARRYDP